MARHVRLDTGCIACKTARVLPPRPEFGYLAGLHVAIQSGAEAARENLCTHHRRVLESQLSDEGGKSCKQLAS